MLSVASNAESGNVIELTLGSEPLLVELPTGHCLMDPEKSEWERLTLANQKDVQHQSNNTLLGVSYSCTHLNVARRGIRYDGEWEALGPARMSVINANHFDTTSANFLDGGAFNKPTKQPSVTRSEWIAKVNNGFSKRGVKETYTDMIEGKYGDYDSLVDKHFPKSAEHLKKFNAVTFNKLSVDEFAWYGTINASALIEGESVTYPISAAFTTIKNYPIQILLYSQSAEEGVIEMLSSEVMAMARRTVLLNPSEEARY